jgi:tRNA/tmRNA/rRNA uracil-C5-methylase (TrmA/RlmC/RlmD family)
VNEIFQVPIESIDKAGYGVVTIQWETMQKQLAPTVLKVRGALPGETVRFRVASIYSTGSAVHTVRVALFGRREHLIRPQTDDKPWRSSVEPSLLPADHQESKYLVEPSLVCPHFDRRHDEHSCAGCTVPHMQYTRQLIEKTKVLKSALAGAVDVGILAELVIVPKSQLSHFSSKHEIHAFSQLPLEAPQWGQPSFKLPFPGERRRKYYVPTPECKLIPNSANPILNRMADLIHVSHAESPEFFSAFDERLNKGYFRSAIIQSGTSNDGIRKHLLSVVVAREPSANFVTALKSEVTSRLMKKFPDSLIGIQLIRASMDSTRDSEFIAHDSRSVTLLEGETDYIDQFIPTANKQLPLQIGTPSYLDGEVANHLASELVASLGSYDATSDPDGVIQLFGGSGELSPVLAELTHQFKSMPADDIIGLVEGSEGTSVPLLETGSMPTHGLVTVGTAGVQATEDQPSTPQHVRQLGPRFKGTAVVAFPQSKGKDDLKGATPKVFRHWLGSKLRPKRIVYITEKFEGLRKDIGHMKLLGYEVKRVKAFDAQPGVMDKIVAFVVLERKPKYKPLEPDQLIE